jgi:hypothetical protein
MPSSSSSPGAGAQQGNVRVMTQMAVMERAAEIEDEEERKRAENFFS